MHFHTVPEKTAGGRLLRGRVTAMDNAGRVWGIIIMFLLYILAGVIIWLAIPQVDAFPFPWFLNPR